MPFPRRAAFAVILAAVASASLSSQQPPVAHPPVLSAPPPADSAGRPALTAADLATFFGGIVPLELERNDIAGAVIAVVKDGQLLFAQGYGYADLAGQQPVQADRTVFRVASISKLFMATAVMQQVERGHLELDQDIQRYLDFSLPRRFSDPVTLRHLLTHTAGFQEGFKQLPADSGKGVPLREWITRMTPDQIYRPGTVTSYSNYGADLGGYIVERVSKTPYAEYVRLNILEPLGMSHSSIAEPLPADLRALLSREYGTASDSAGEFEILQGEPSGNLSATATDMAKFAIAHLQLGRFGDQRILREETARLMGATQFRTHPAVPGMGLGFFEEDRNGRRIIGHGGDLARFHSQLSLLMDEGVAFFVSVNSAGRGSSLFSLREAVVDAFLDRYFHRTAPLEPVVADARERSRRFAGSYTLSRRGETSMGRLIGLVVDLSVRANDDGSVEIPFVAGPNGRPVRWYPIDSTTFRNRDGSQRIGFVPASPGLPARMGFLGGHELHRVGWADDRSFNLVLIGAVVSVFAGTLLFWPVAALIRRRYAASFRDDGVGVKLRSMTRLGALFSFAFVAGLAIFFMNAFSGAMTPTSRFDPLLAVIRLVGLLGMLGTIVSLVALGRSIGRGRNGWARLKYLALTLAGVGFSWFAVHWNLISGNFRY